jgi:hypothetical protein
MADWSSIRPPFGNYYLRFAFFSERTLFFDAHGFGPLEDDFGPLEEDRSGSTSNSSKAATSASVNAQFVLESKTLVREAWGSVEISNFWRGIVVYGRTAALSCGTIEIDAVHPWFSD